MKIEIKPIGFVSTDAEEIPRKTPFPGELLRPSQHCTSARFEPKIVLANERNEEFRTQCQVFERDSTIVGTGKQSTPYKLETSN